MVEEITIRDKIVHVLSPEKQHASMSVEKLLQIINRSNGCFTETGYILPNGVKLVTSRGEVIIVIYERNPQIYNKKWIANNSPVPFGRRTKYRSVRIALPYLIVVAVFVLGEDNLVHLSNHNECFFRTAPLKSLDDKLRYPGLLNCSKFEQPYGMPLSWICTTKIDHSQIEKERNDEARMRVGLHTLLHCLLETGYNFSSDHHESSSWFTESTRVDPRISTIENWERATTRDPLFVLDVPWLRTKLSIRQIIERIFRNLNAIHLKVTSAADIMRIIFNHANSEQDDIPF